MWDDIGQLGQTLIIIATIASAAASGLFWGDRKRLASRLTEERTQNDRNRIEIHELEADVSEERTRNERLVNQLQAVTAIKTNEAAIATVTELLTTFGQALNNHHGAAESNWTNQAELMTGVIAQLTAVMQEVRKLVEAVEHQEIT